MKRPIRIILLIIVLITICYPAVVFSQESNYNYRDIEDLIKTMGNEMTLMLIKDHGIDCSGITDEKLQELRGLGANDAVINAIREACKVLSPPIEVENHLKAGYTFLNQGQYHKAIDEFTKVLKIDPDNKKALDGIDKAKATIEREKREVTEEKKKDVRDHLGVGNLYMRKGFYDEAIEEFRKVLKIDPDNQKALDGIDKAKREKVISPPPNPPHHFKLELLYDFSKRYISTRDKDKIEELEKNRMGIARLRYCCIFNDKLGGFFAIGAVWTALSDTKKFGDSNFVGGGGGIKWIVSRSFPLLPLGDFFLFDVDLKGEVFGSVFGSKSIWTTDILNRDIKREISWWEINLVLTITYTSLEWLQPYASVLYSPINRTRVKYKYNEISAYNFKKNNPFGISGGVKIILGRPFGHVLSLSVEVRNSEFRYDRKFKYDKNGITGYSAGMGFSF